MVYCNGLVSNPRASFRVRSLVRRQFVALSSLKVHTQTRGAEIIMFQAATYTAETAHGEGVVGLQKNWPAEKISLASTNVVLLSAFVCPAAQQLWGCCRINPSIYCQYLEGSIAIFNINT